MQTYRREKGFLMKIIICALKQEADAIRPYIDDETKIEICGISAKNLSFAKNLKNNDFIINFGICAGKHVGEIYQCSKIIGNKDYYPDIFTGINIKQACIKLSDSVVDSEEVNANPDILFDMESAKIFDVCSKVLQPHQMSFLKIVSDAGSPDIDTILSQVKIFTDKHSELIKNYFREIDEFLDNQHFDKNIDIGKISNALKCSVSMQNRLKQQLRYAKIIEADLDKFFNKLKNEDKIPVEHKKDGIKILNELDKFLIGGEDE